MAQAPANQSQGFSIAGTVRFFREVRAELNRVTWPKLADTRRMTVMVFILVTIIALFLVAVDMLIGAGLNLLWSL